VIWTYFFFFFILDHCCFAFKVQKSYLKFILAHPYLFKLHKTNKKMKNMGGLEVRGHILENARYDMDTFCDFFSCSFSFGVQKVM
jgi:uncharacterized C2H2 Zn-finger protein